MRSLNPPFRADHVGSVLRPRRLLDARACFQKSEMTKAQLRAVEDDAIREVVRKEESIGLQSVTDGEFRRTFFHIDFLQRLQGVAITGGIAKTVVLGLVSTKTPQLESAKTLTDRIKEAARYVPLDNLCLSPQCGFASTVQGNEITEADQWAKLELVVNTARDVWGGVV